MMTNNTPISSLFVTLKEIWTCVSPLMAQAIGSAQSHSQ